MKIAEVVQPILQPKVPVPVSKNYTWEQSLRFFAIGLIRNCWISLGPVARAFYIQLHKKHSVHWQDIGWMALSAVAIPAYTYYAGHKQLLKLPEWAEIPQEFVPADIKTTTLMDESGQVVLTKVEETHKEPVPINPVDKQSSLEVPAK